ncbi:MAG: hypothetical protein NZM29_07670 [Nitrospira sp.]|nr:hypothetical protein [Nitrospira sp.]
MALATAAGGRRSNINDAIELASVDGSASGEDCAEFLLHEPGERTLQDVLLVATDLGQSRPSFIKRETLVDRNLEDFPFFVPIDVSVVVSSQANFVMEALFQGIR